jgi:hypothetical protein
MNHPLLAVCNCLFNIFTATPPYLEVISPICNLRTHEAMATWDPLNMELLAIHFIILYIKKRGSNHFPTYSEPFTTGWIPLPWLWEEHTIHSWVCFK